MHPAQLRDGVVAALWQAGEGKVLTQEALLTVVEVDHQKVVLASCGLDDAALERRLPELATGLRGTVHVLLLEADPFTARTLVAALPPGLGVHRSLRGEAISLSGPPLPGAVALAVAAPGSPVEVQEAGARQAEVGQLGETLRKTFPWATAVITGACVLIYVLGMVWGGGKSNLVLLNMGALSRESVERGEWWRVLSATFLHANFLHLAMNMLALVSFGVLLERLLGWQRFVVLYVVSGLAGGLASYFMGKHAVSVGASGAIWGLMTAGVALALRPHGLLPPLLVQQSKGRLLGPLAFNLLYSFQPGIDIWAHLGGGVAGFALMFSGLLTAGVTPQWKTQAAPRRSGSMATVVAALSALVLAGSLGLALAKGRPWHLSAPPPRQLVTSAIGSTRFQIDLPPGLAGPVFEAPKYSWGDLEKDGMVVEVLITGVPPGSEAEALDQVQEMINTNPIQGFNRVANAVKQELGGHTMLVTRYTAGEGAIILRTWFRIMGDRAVMVRIYSTSTRDRAWDAVDPGIVLSLRER